MTCILLTKAASLRAKWCRAFIVSLQNERFILRSLSRNDARWLDILERSREHIATVFTVELSFQQQSVGVVDWFCRGQVITQNERKKVSNRVARGIQHFLYMVVDVTTCSEWYRMLIFLKTLPEQQAISRLLRMICCGCMCVCRSNRFVSLDFHDASSRVQLHPQAIRLRVLNEKVSLNIVFDSMFILNSSSLVTQVKRAIYF